jgi:hypothetical protein
MKNSTKSTGGSKRHVGSEQIETIQHNGKILATIRKRPGEVEFELSPEIRDVNAVFVRVKNILMEAAEQYLDAELDDECNKDDEWIRREMKAWNKSTPEEKRRGCADQTEIEIHRNGKIMATLRNRRDEMEIELAPFIRDTPGKAVEVLDHMIEAMEQLVNSKLDDKSNGDL